eukprot:gene10239-269_t
MPRPWLALTACASGLELALDVVRCALSASAAWASISEQVSGIASFAANTSEPVPSSFVLCSPLQSAPASCNSGGTTGRTHAMGWAAGRARVLSHACAVVLLDVTVPSDEDAPLVLDALSQATDAQVSVMAHTICDRNSTDCFPDVRAPLEPIQPPSLAEPPESESPEAPLAESSGWKLWHWLMLLLLIIPLVSPLLAFSPSPPRLWMACYSAVCVAIALAWRRRNRRPGPFVERGSSALLRPGDVVRIDGLLHSPQFDGQCGSIIGFNSATKAYHIQLRDTVVIAPRANLTQIGSLLPSVPAMHPGMPATDYTAAVAPSNPHPPTLPTALNQPNLQLLAPPAQHHPASNRHTSHQHEHIPEHCLHGTCCVAVVTSMDSTTLSLPPCSVQATLAQLDQLRLQEASLRWQLQSHAPVAPTTQSANATGFPAPPLRLLPDSPPNPPLSPLHHKHTYKPASHPLTGPASPFDIVPSTSAAPKMPPAPPAPPASTYVNHSTQTPGQNQGTSPLSPGLESSPEAWLDDTMLRANPMLCVHLSAVSLLLGHNNCSFAKVLSICDPAKQDPQRAVM